GWCFKFTLKRLEDVGKESDFACEEVGAEGDRHDALMSAERNEVDFSEGEAKTTSGSAAPTIGSSNCWMVSNRSTISTSTMIKSTEGTRLLYSPTFPFLAAIAAMTFGILTGCGGIGLPMAFSGMVWPVAATW